MTSTISDYTSNGSSANPSVRLHPVRETTYHMAKRVRDSANLLAERRLVRLPTRPASVRARHQISLHAQSLARAQEARWAAWMPSSPKSVIVSGNPIEEGSLRLAQSCPQTYAILQVEPQGPGAEIAGLGVAIALRRLLSDFSDPVRPASLNLRRPLRIGLTCVSPRLAGLAS